MLIRAQVEIRAVDRGHGTEVRLVLPALAPALSLR